MNHGEWQQQVTDMAAVYGWQFLHVRKSIGKGKRWQTTTNIRGWPDLLLWKAGMGFVGLELKVGKDKPTPEQLAVLDTLEAAGAKALVAYPEDLAALQALFASRVLGNG